jgi:RNA polymerase I-specific transcription initiation factor RRN6
MSHNHSHDHSHDGHDHGHGGHDHDHSHDLTPALQSLLHEQIEFDKIVTLNEAVPRSGAKVVQKTWAQRLDSEPELASDSDEQILMTIP